MPTMIRLLASMTCLVLAASPAAAQAIKTYEKSGTSYDDVRFDLTNAIVGAGLSVSSTGRVGEMLDRTGEAVGSTKKIYRNAEFFTFCSAKVTRALVEADPLNIAFCPTTMFLFEPEDRPGTVVVGYRRPVATDARSAAAVTAAEALLDQIARDAVQ
jgi:uncharacterized protein (DUF302 family)